MYRLHYRLSIRSMLSNERIPRCTDLDTARAAVPGHYELCVCEPGAVPMSQECRGWHHLGHLEVFGPFPLNSCLVVKTGGFDFYFWDDVEVNYFLKRLQATNQFNLLEFWTPLGLRLLTSSGVNIW